MLAPLVLERKLPVSTAEELLGASDTAARKDLAMRAAERNWTVGQVRKAILRLVRIAPESRTSWRTCAAWSPTQPKLTHRPSRPRSGNKYLKHASHSLACSEMAPVRGFCASSRCDIQTAVRIHLRAPRRR